MDNELILKYFDTTNAHITRIPEFPTRFTAVPLMKFGPNYISAQNKIINKQMNEGGNGFLA
jgi:hypothetical protein